MRNDIISIKEKSSLITLKLQIFIFKDKIEAVYMTLYTKSKIRYLHKHSLTLNIAMAGEGVYFV